MSAPTPDALLTVAEQLIPSGVGAPSIAHLRRAISTAYYAVFCALCLEVGKPYPGSLGRVASRLVAHNAARSVLTNLTRKKRNRPIFTWLPNDSEGPDQSVCDPDLSLFAESFELLLKQREDADYNYLWKPSKRDAEAAINTAKEAIARFEQAKANRPDQVRAVCLAVIVRDRKRMQF